jgi:prepilin-type N-terminal cleavage/methylation domain-containing protein
MTHSRIHRFSAAVAPVSSGFTLVELLAASAIGLMMTLAGLAMYMGNLQANTALLRSQNLRDNWSRVNLFINSDIAEASQAAIFGGSLVLTLDKTPDDDCGTGSVTVTYSLADGTLTRTGPPILPTGEVNRCGAAAAENLIEGVTAFDPDPTCTTALRACYKLTLTKGGSTYTGNGGANIEGHARVRQYS